MSNKSDSNVKNLKEEPSSNELSTNKTFLYQNVTYLKNNFNLNCKTYR